VTRAAADIRNEFLDFFRQRGHEIVPGSPLVPYDDPTLLFTNAGMNQFKDVFLATGTRPYNRAADTQPCIRAGGKHNDLDDVGHDAYHHTFFEMLGNWSFGDYFKREAIEWAWELLTEVWGLDKQRLHATYFGGSGGAGILPANPDELDLEPDFEARDLWAEITDIDPGHIHPGSTKDNFWEMGETGPCGPCSEIHIDLTPDKSGAKLVNAGDPRVIEIWNLVFIQFNRGPDGKLTPLPAKHVDTGMGFERVCALLQGKSSNYDTDLFAPIFQAIRDITGAPPYGGSLPSDVSPADPSSLRGSVAPSLQTMIDTSYRVIADHIRCLTFALNDGAVPDREGRGYVLRRILRRAVRYGWQYFDVHEPFLYKLVPAVVESLGDAFPQLRGGGRRPAGRDDLTRSPAVGPQRVAEIIREEEESFDRTLDRGIALFEEAADFAARRHHGVICGEDAFKLHDTYGFPIDLTEIMAEEKGLRVDIGEYERLMEQARERARGAAERGVPALAPLSAELAASLGPTDDSAKYSTEFLEAEVTAILRLDQDGSAAALGPHDGLYTGLSGALVLNRTCFYAEQGGQVGDRGIITAGSEEEDWFNVDDTVHVGGAVLHVGTVRRGAFGLTEPVTIKVHQHRARTMQNHTATHVMNWALREVLGDHVQQKGSLVDPEKTRFDFSHSKPMTPEEIERVEALVNERIGENLPVYADYRRTDEARRINGLRAVFGEKYPDPVRIVASGVSIEDLIRNPDNPEWRRYPIELCGGTHCKSTGQIVCFAIVSEEAVAKGIRRVVGITGDAARRGIETGTDLLKRADRLKTGPTEPSRDREGAVFSPDDFAARVTELQKAADEATIRVVDRVKLRAAIGELQQLIKKQQKQQAAEALDVVNVRIDELLRAPTNIGDTTVIVAEMPDVPIDQLKNGADRIKQKCKSAAVLFGVVQEATERRSDEATKGSAGVPPADTARRAAAHRPSEPERSSAGPPSPAEQKRDRKGATAKALLLAAMTPDLVKKGLKAGDLVKHLAPLIGGRGGGPPTMAQAGGKDPNNLPAALEAGREWLNDKLRR
jgi:alanyl-tRNA synthetase